MVLSTISLSCLTCLTSDFFLSFSSNRDCCRNSIFPSKLLPWSRNREAQLSLSCREAYKTRKAQGAAPVWLTITTKRSVWVDEDSISSKFLVAGDWSICSTFVIWAPHLFSCSTSQQWYNLRLPCPQLVNICVLHCVWCMLQLMHNCARGFLVIHLAQALLNKCLQF